MFQTSSTADLTVPATYVHEATTQNYVSAAMMALILYEHGVTFWEELEFIWHRKWSWVTLLFLVNRYGVVAYGALNIASGLVHDQLSCDSTTRATEALVLWLMLMFGICSALRVYVLWNKDIILFLAVLALNLVPVAANLYLYSFVTPKDMNKYVIAAARVSTIVVDTIVLTVTLIKTWQTQLNARRLHMKVPLTTMLIRDGTTYFITVLAMNIAQLIVFQLTEQVYLISFICTLTAILISRFFLDLREVAMGGGGILDSDAATTIKGNAPVPLKHPRQRPRVDSYELGELGDAGSTTEPRTGVVLASAAEANKADDITEVSSHSAV